MSQTEATKVSSKWGRGKNLKWPRIDLVVVTLSHSNFDLLFMSTLANESLLETFYEEALEEMGIKNDSPFFADACKIAEQIAMDRLLSH